MKNDSEVNLHQYALKLHAAYISEPSSEYDSNDRESDLDFEHYINEPPPELLETRSIIACEPFQVVKRRRKETKPNKRPTITVNSLSKATRQRFRCRTKNRHKLSNAKTSNVPHANLSLEEQMNNCNLNIDNSNATVVNENCKKTSSIDDCVKVPLFSNVNRDTIGQNPVEGTNNIAKPSEPHYSVFDFFKLNRHNYARLDNQPLQSTSTAKSLDYYAPEGTSNNKGSAPAKIVTTIVPENVAGSNKLPVNYIGLSCKMKQNQVKPTSTSNPNILAAPEKGLKENAKIECKQRKKSLQNYQNHVSSNSATPLIASSNRQFITSANSRRNKNSYNILNATLEPKGAKSKIISMQSFLQAHAPEVVPQQCNKKEFANRMQSTNTTQKSYVVSRLAQPPPNVAVNSELANKNLSRKQLRTMYFKQRQAVQNASHRSSENCSNQPGIKSAQLSHVDTSKSMSHAELLGSKSADNISNQFHNNQNRKEHFQNRPMSNKQNLSNKKADIQPLMGFSRINIHTDSNSMHNTNLQYSAPPRRNRTNAGCSLPSVLPTYEVAKPQTAKKKRNRNKKKKERGVQTDYSLKHMRSIGIQTDDLEQMKNDHNLPVMLPPNTGDYASFDEFMYDYCAINNFLHGQNSNK